MLPVVPREARLLAPRVQLFERTRSVRYANYTGHHGGHGAGHTGVGRVALLARRGRGPVGRRQQCPLHFFQYLGKGCKCLLGCGCTADVDGGFADGVLELQAVGVEPDRLVGRGLPVAVA